MKFRLTGDEHEDNQDDENQEQEKVKNGTETEEASMKPNSDAQKINDGRNGCNQHERTENDAHDARDEKRIRGPLAGESRRGQGLRIDESYGTYFRHVRIQEKVE